ncbi:MAG: hypothetical protein OK456_09390 [Thaumarchaeota archaeon]|nr:hypothetical protein [Nitrososphaerota archaeon]
MGLDSNVELALLEELEVVAEVRLVDAEDDSVDVEHEGEAWIVLDVTGSATVEAENTGAWAEVVVEILVDAEVAVPWMLLTK